MERIRHMVRPALAVLTVAALAIFVAVALPGRGGRASDHLDSPNTKKDGRTDLADLYVFHPKNAAGFQDRSRTVLVMTVNPAAGVISGTEFDPQARYEFAIDRNGDAVEDDTLRVRVIGGVALVNHVTATRNTPIAISRLEENGRGLGDVEGVVRLYAGVRDDPFFLDLNAFNAGAKFCQGAGGTGSNFFKGFNSSAIVLEIPSGAIGGGNIGVWARTMVRNAAGDWTQIDRVGRPAINTVFIPVNPFEPGASQKDSFNTTNPNDDQAKWRPEIVNTLQLLFSLNDASGDDKSDDAGKIAALADVLLPDVLTADLSKDTGFLNGRGLEDDVIDAELGLITEGAVKTDCVANDSTFLSAFPYLGVKN